MSIALVPSISADDAAEYFEKQIRPLLAEHCYSCHSPKAEKLKGKLDLSTFAGFARGGESGPVVVPGDVDKSRLIVAVRYKNKDLQMPPKQPLPAKAVATLEHWVLGGAEYPKDQVATQGAAPVADDGPKFKDVNLWSLKPPQKAPPPPVKDAAWPLSPIDNFIRAKLDEQNLKPVAAADKHTLIRRATFDLLGLPPTNEEVEAFVNDAAPDAFAKVVDSLLASPHYGERWGRHWLDQMRYADTAGDSSDYPVPQAYRYRDYVIKSFNKDKPYAQFLREQIAGDLLTHEDAAEQREHIIATGYLAIARRFGVREREDHHLTIDDTIDNLGKAVLGLTLGCARCHDHKFDPVSMRDYYALYGIFASTRYPHPGCEKKTRPYDFVPLDAPDQLAYAVQDGKAQNGHIFKRGDPQLLGPEVRRGTIEVLGGYKVSATSLSSGRLELARWITDPSHPLTARVWVNRVWQYHFGQGLVRTSSDFGTRGLLPTHPELLDWLAVTFIEKNGSTKALHRLLLNSRTYQLAASHDAENVARDPNNYFLWRFSRRRLDAEQLRDAILFVSGELDLVPGEAHPFPSSSSWKFTQHEPFEGFYSHQKRSIYMMTQRLRRHTFMELFDGPDANANTAARSNAVTPVQALFMMNSGPIQMFAGKLATLLLGEKDERKRIDQAHRRAFGRPASGAEIERGLAYVQRASEAYKKTDEEAGKHTMLAWTSYVRTLLSASEFQFVE